MADIKFASGLQEFTLNGKVEVSFNPTDMTFTEELYNAASALAKRQDELEEAQRAETEPEKIFTLNREADKEMRDIIDGVFGKPICSDLFGATKVFAYSDGLPLWANMIFAVQEMCVSKRADEAQKTDKRLAKYTAKYKRK